MTDWISVTDRLPEPGEDVLAVYSYNHIVNAVYIAIYDGDRWYVYGVPVQVTYWMPLPTPPKEDETQDGQDKG